jgi:Family of unknown function (DUF5996)
MFAAEGVCQTPLPKIHTQIQQRHVVNLEQSLDSLPIFHNIFLIWRLLMVVSAQGTSVDIIWPSLPLAAWQDTYATLHLWTQVIGKIRLALAPKLNHWWQSLVVQKTFPSIRKRKR